MAAESNSAVIGICDDCVHHVVVTAPSVAAARAHLCGALHFALAHGGADDASALLWAPARDFALELRPLSPQAAAAAEEGGIAEVAWRVADLECARAALRARGVHFEYRVRTPGPYFGAYPSLLIPGSEGAGYNIALFASDAAAFVPPPPAGQQQAQAAPAVLPDLGVGAFDHYTIIVADAARSLRFHTEALGFTFSKTIEVNTGSAPEGKYDMLNHVCFLPHSVTRVLVITQGYTPDSIFCKLLTKYGEFVHHVAHQVPDVDAAFATLRANGIELTNGHVSNDYVTGLRQLFISRKHASYFIELIARVNSTSKEGDFTQHNMADLVSGMDNYL
eukprot:TRINITY_DN7728_c0_g1_i1.p1 TRINITY_DN7728_c0_g1~~TRINITY_DN7728_c0_g1_i1.p1  ORF type:complete len:334 (-),score=108.68 TRINITY_DN7728_c0_g1_i1:118-1119(-)